MLRAIALSLALLVGIGAIVPLATHYAEAGSKKHAKSKKREWKGVKKYSKRWWQLYRRQEKRKKTRAKARRALRLHQIRLANAKKVYEKGSVNQNHTAKSTRKSAVADTTQAFLPTGENAPKGWKRGQPSNSELQYRVDNDNGSQVGAASIAVVGPAVGGQNDSPRSKTVGGVAMSSLRRTVIDKMVREEGWVVNDYQKEIGGKNVYVVVAQSPGAGNRVQSRLFYFTEVDGKIYSVATNAPSDDSKRIEQESERVINSLQRRGGTQQAELK